MSFLNREDELRVLNDWWARPGARLGLVWGRRRVGKTSLVQRFAAEHPVVFHTGGGRPVAEELRFLSRAAQQLVGRSTRSLIDRPFTDWMEVFEELAEAARRRKVLLVLDEFPELLDSAPELPSVLRAVWDKVKGHTGLRILLCGSAVRVMESMREERAPLYGRLDLSLLLHPMQPHEAAMFLPGTKPREQAIVWGIVGGIPLYLEWWDPGRSVGANLESLVCTPGGHLLTEGQLVMATEGEAGDLGRQVLYAIAAGRTKHNEIADAIRADPTRTLDRLTELRLIERLLPVTEDPRRTRRRLYRIADNFLAFWLSIVDRYRAEIERGLGRTILPVLLEEIDTHLGSRWEEAFRIHLRRMADRGQLGEGVVAVGPFWTSARDPIEIDAVVLAGRGGTATLVGEAKWTRRLSGERVRRVLEHKSRSLPRVSGDLRYAVCASEAVTDAQGVIAVTASEIFAGELG